MSYHSIIYGLQIRLNALIPGIALSQFANNPPDVDITFGSMPYWLNFDKCAKKIWYVSPDRDDSNLPRIAVWHLPDQEHYQIKYADGTEFLVDKQGTRIWATWPAETLTSEDTATYLLGPVMGFILLLRGCISLHASAVVMDQLAIALVGPAGSGKSTTAAALANLGYAILAEDVVTLADFGTEFLVQPAYPSIRLWPASVRALYGENAELPKLTPTWDKCYLDLTLEQYSFQKEPLPLAAIYLLDERSSNPSSPSIHLLSHADALISLIANTYATYLMDKAMRARSFDMLGRVCKSVPVRRVTPHTNPENISALCSTISDDFDKLKSANHSMTVNV